jgi:hypothetical protein
VWKVKSLNKGTTNYKFSISMPIRKCICFCQTHLQLTNMEYETYKIRHAKAPKKKINPKKKHKITDQK